MFGNVLSNVNVINNKWPRDRPNPKYVWHLQLGHIGEDRITKLCNDEYIDPSNFEPHSICEACLLRKLIKAPFVGHNARAVDMLGLIHMNVYGPHNELAGVGYSCFVTFTDDLSRYGYLYLVKYKFESFEKFKEFGAKVEKQTKKSITAI